MFEKFKLEEVTPEIKTFAPRQKLFRSDIGDDRYYYDEEGGTYMSVTSAVKYMIPAGAGLMKFYAKNSEEEISTVLNESSSYGTLMHTVFTEILRSGHGNFDTIAEWAWEEALACRMPHLAHEWAYRITKDTASFLTFIKEKEIEVISAELPVASRTYRLGGCIDLVCKMKFGKKIVVAIVDYKSGRKGFYPQHELQLEIYKQLFTEVYGDLFNIEMLFNWSPNDFKKLSTPTYKLKNQTGNRYSPSIKQRLNILLSEGVIRDSHRTEVFTGDFKIGDELSKNIAKL